MSDLGPYCLQYRLPKRTKVVIGGIGAKILRCLQMLRPSWELGGGGGGGQWYHFSCCPEINGFSPSFPKQMLNPEIDILIKHQRVLSVNPYKPIVLFVGHRQTLQNQIRRRKMRYLIRLSTACLQMFFLTFE